MSRLLFQVVGLLAILFVGPASFAQDQSGSGASVFEGCMSRRDAIAQVKGGLVVPLRDVRPTAEEAAGGEMINAALCKRDNRTVYVVTVLGMSGKVAYVTLDATNGRLLNMR